MCLNFWQFEIVRAQFHGNFCPICLSNYYQREVSRGVMGILWGKLMLQGIKDYFCHKVDNFIITDCL